ncbi:hypothetical protein SAMN05444339_10164 [Loktanella atrilutea]|uniref:Uncharacterized protein n=1 Tax=Loktanella atrilutea TaxID=366533 RepID=A0A1M4SL42_LOKAT|nr:hypothetical protein [Loktanella atrilutea]SHE32963.1 hypothetical protein SAMN05444339_10164 [Loktanella atrilutea]
MRQDLRITLALIGMTSPAFGDPYDGTYRQAANSECALVGIDGGSVRIADGIFYGVEVSCRMTNPVNVLDMDALLYTMQCSGEDQEFSERAMLMNKAQGDGIIMVWDGYAFVYDRCPEPGKATVPGPVADAAAPDDGAGDAVPGIADVAPEVTPAPASVPTAPAAGD